MSQIQDVKQATDIVQILGERLQLQRAGANFRALCPFHTEKSPSFYINEQLQRYKCFGCGESGDIFTFLEKYEGMTFAESLQYLADRAGITLLKQSFTPEDDQRKRLLEILDLAKEYYQFLLVKHETGKIGRDYLHERGVTQESLRVFQLGYASASWDSLLKYLTQKKNYAVADIQATGLVVTTSGGRMYDRFRGRLMFPLTDHRGRVVGFSGRILDKNEKEAKYINTPETVLYHKGQMLFGYSQLYQHLRKESEAVVVEGEFDVISSSQAHVNHVVAVKGSALTEDHMKLLSRTVSKVILSFDMDSAGIAATKRALRVAEPFGLEVRVIDFSQVDDGGKKDPDDLARTQPTLWRKMVKSSISVYDFLIQSTIKAYDVTTPEGKRHVIDELAPFLGNISHAVEYEFYVDKVAAKLNVGQTVIKSDLQKFKTLKKEGFTSGSSRKKESTPEESPALTRKSRLEEYILFLLFHSPEEKIVERAEKLKHITFSVPGMKQLIEHVLRRDTSFSLSAFSQTLPDDLQQILLDVSIQKEYLDLLPTIKVDVEWQKIIRELIELDIADEIKKITEELDHLDGISEKTEENETRQQDLLRRIIQLRGKKF